MRDQPLTIAEAARWLRCSDEEVRGYVESGQLRPFAGAAPGAEPVVSLNSVVILAESLPAEQGVFQVRDMPASLDRPSSDRPPHGGPRPSGNFGGPRPGLIVERRPSRSIPRG